MSKGLIGRKVGMTTVFAEDGTAQPVTVIEVQPNLVFGHRTKERDGYAALQLAHEELSEKELEGNALGSQITVELFKKGDKVDVTGTTCGFGFAGVFKRHHMKGAARDSSTAHELHRHPGAIGQRKTPGRVFKNKRMPGHMGVDRRTVQNLPVIDVIPENHLLLVGGSIPGHRKQLVFIRPAVK